MFIASTQQILKYVSSPVSSTNEAHVYATDYYLQISLACTCY